MNELVLDSNESMPSSLGVSWFGVGGKCLFNIGPLKGADTGLPEGHICGRLLDICGGVFWWGVDGLDRGELGGGSSYCQPSQTKAIGAGSDLVWNRQRGLRPVSIRMKIAWCQRANELPHRICIRRAGSSL